MPQHILAFGHFDLEGGRSWVLRTGLERHGCRVTLCRTEVPGLIAKYRDLWRQSKSLPTDIDAIYVPFLGQYLLPLAWWIARRRRIPLIADAFLSLYDTEVHDRRTLSRWHPRAWLLWLADWMTCRLPNMMLIDTPEYADYFVKTFRARREKIVALPIGCRTDLFRPLPPSPRAPGDTAFHVEFHGTFIPLQGIETILGAARILQERHDDVRFTFIGKGQTYDTMVQLASDLKLTNVTFTGALPMDQIPQRIADADVCLGIFGTTDKANRVIPNKAYEILACGKPLITANTTATQRVLQNGKTAMLTTPGNSDELANAIETLKADQALRDTIAAQGKQISETQFTPEKIVEPLAKWIQEQQR